MVLDSSLGGFGAVSDAATRRVTRATTRRGVASLRVDNISGRKYAQSKERDCHFATWNVRSLVNSSGPVETAFVRGERLSRPSDDRRIDTVVSELKRLDVEVAGLQETRWFGKDSYAVGDAVVLASGRPLPSMGESFFRGEGVALVLRGRALRAWKAGGGQWSAVSSRLAVAKLRMVSRKKFFTIHVLVCYAPTFRSSRMEKEIFFAELQGALHAIPRHDKFVLLGDFNARVGTRFDDADEWTGVRGPRGFGECNDAGKELLAFLSLNNATICNTWFSKKPVFKQSWQHPNTKEWHAIDFIITHQRDRRFCKDCQVVCTADCGSDHRLVRLTFKLPHTRFDHQRSSPKQLRFAVNRFKPSDDMSDNERKSVLECVKAFQSSVASSLVSASFNDTPPSVEDRWGVFRDSMVRAGSEHLGFTRPSQPDWFTAKQDELAPLIQKRRLMYNRWIASQTAGDYSEFKIARSKARFAVRRAKNDWLVETAQRVEGFRHSGTSWTAIRSIQRCFRGLKPVSSVALKKEDGLLCDTAQEISARWERHFNKILNVPSTFNPATFDSLRKRPVWHELADPPSAEDLAKAVKQLAKNKAPGASGILPEMVQHAGEEAISFLLSLVHQVWAEGCVPQAWRDAEIVPIPKKGDLSLCDNWRGIALLDVVGKLVGRLVHGRLQVLAESELPDSQCGFRRGRSCTDQIFSVSQHIEKLYEHRTSGCLVFIDLRKAYDSVSREALWRALEVLGVPPSLIKTIASFHSDMSAKVRVGGSHTNKISVNNGLRQGCSMAPVLFNLLFSLVVEKWRQEMDVADGDHKVWFNFNSNGKLFNRPRTAHKQDAASDLEFADDAILITPSQQSAHLALTTFVAVAKSFGLSVNFSKTKAMDCGNVTIDRQPLSVDGHTVEFVEAFNYLGSLQSDSGRCSAEIDRRLASASRAFGALQCVFRDSNLSIKTKRLIYSACVLSTLLYGAECWAILRQDEARLDSFHHRCLRAILGVSRWTQQHLHVTNGDLRHRWGDPLLASDVLRKRRLQWLGHVARMPEERLPKKLLFGWLPQTRPAHGPRLRWKDRVADDLKRLNIHDWYAVAQDRAQWRGATRTVTEAPPVKAFPCSACGRSFKSSTGRTRHKCTAERMLPVEKHRGARHCERCNRWFRSAGGFAVHKCRLHSATTSPPERPSSPQHADKSQQCCPQHCTRCDRCFKSSSGFKRHNCDRGKTRPIDRVEFEHQCHSCSRKFRRPGDLKRHKCKK